MSSEISMWDMRKYENRLNTYNGWILNYLSPRKMASSGFYFLGRQDEVTCMYCFKHFEYWLQDDDPIDTHRRTSPECEYFNKNHALNVCKLYGVDLPAVQQQRSNPVNDHMRFSPELEFSNENQAFNMHSLRDALPTFGNNIQNHQLPSMESNTTNDNVFKIFEFRLQTFNKCKILLRLDIHYLSDAGFIYTGNGMNDITTCFSCNKMFRDWTFCDDPWMQHALYSSTCKFLLESRGKEYIDLVHIVHRNEYYSRINSENQENMSNSVALLPSVTNNTAVNSTIGKSSSDRNASEIRRVDIETALDYMKCKVCFMQEIKTVFIPCRHTFACYSCTSRLKQCGICRAQCTISLSLLIKFNTVEDLQLIHNSSDNSKQVTDPILCKICHRENMQITFVPCMHVYACAKCSQKIKHCPVCDKEIISKIKIYI